MNSGIAGTVPLSKSIFDDWSTYAKFAEDLRECCAIVSIRSGLKISVADVQLQTVHKLWLHEQSSWLHNLLPAGTTELSHIKKAAILLSKFCEIVPIDVSGSGHVGGTSTISNIQDGGLGELPHVLPEGHIKKFKDGGCHYVAWLLLHEVCQFFERYRTDRSDPFISRITEEFELDMVSALISGRMSSQSIHLVFKALFLRD